MKAIFISCNQALYVEVMQIMERQGVRGYTAWEELMGCGSRDGEPHLGSHAWPTMNSALIAVMEDAQAAEYMQRLKQLDADNDQQGLRAFAWPVSDMI